jgi:hypothetical protein
MAFFKAREHAPLPTTDILSWIFDNPTYDINKPVHIRPALPIDRPIMNLPRS